MHRNIFETVMGGVVLLVAALFLWVAYTMAEVEVLSGYQVSAAFSQLGGLPVGSDVQVSGVKVGSVSARRLDPVTFEAIITMGLDKDVKLPEDTVAMIASEGVLGGKFVRLDPGRSKTMIPPGGKIGQTRPYRSLEDQVGEIIFLATGKPGSGAADGGTGGEQP